MNTSTEGHVTFGDKTSTVRLLGTCTFMIMVGMYISKMAAHIIDSDSGSAQHIVIGDEWNDEHRTMLGALRAAV